MTPTRSESQPMLYSVVRNQRFGYIDAAGNVVVPIDAESILQFSEGLGGVWHGPDLEIVNAKGTIVAHCKNVGSDGKFSNGLLAVYDRLTRKDGYIDHRGEWIVSPRFYDAGDFHNQVAIACNKGLFEEGVIDRNGNWLCEPKCHQIFDFDENTAATVAYVPRGDGDLDCLLIDREGRPVGTTIYEYGGGPGEGLIPFSQQSKWGFVSDTGELVIPFTFDGLNRFSEGKAAARGPDELIGVIDKTGHWLIHPSFAYINDCSEGLFGAAIKGKSGRWGFIDLNGKWVIEPTYDDVGEFCGGIAEVYFHSENEREGPKTGFIDKSGKYVWEPTN